ncbi:IS3 family transposase [Paenibacillus gorillae]|uniref:IS3 family transposase n=1 Tax=Paenibacillus gorillae TaxID=1243662 RepID=UPI0012DE8E4E|nr:IS3 family transposase [Paenibacillus gorillae]
MNHKKVPRLMQEMNLKSIIRRKTKAKPQGDGLPPLVAENLLNRDFSAAAPKQKWVTDITQYAVGETWLYLSAIKDLCTKEIVSYQMSLRNNTQLVLDTFEQVLKKGEDVPDLIVHSDQGCQYTSHAYHNMLNQVSAKISMSRRGNCYDNAAMESFFSHLKAEALYPYSIGSLEDAQERIHAFIHYYNHERIQLKLNKLAPIDYRNQLTA